MNVAPAAKPIPGSDSAYRPIVDHLPRAILFDLDDTLITFGNRREQLEVVAGEFGLPRGAPRRSRSGSTPSGPTPSAIASGASA